MLVLSRKLGEKITIDCDGVLMEITLVDIDRNKVRLGIVAPRHVSVMRNELLPPSVPAPTTTESKG